MTPPPLVLALPLSPLLPPALETSSVAPPLSLADDPSPSGGLLTYTQAIRPTCYYYYYNYYYYYYYYYYYHN
jgi:hypothetical protein